MSSINYANRSKDDPELATIFSCPLTPPLSVTNAAPSSAVGANDGIGFGVIVSSKASRRGSLLLNASCSGVSEYANALTGFARTPRPVFANRRSGVLRSEAVSVDARGLSRVARWDAIAAQRILARGDCLQVGGIHTAPISAQVIQFDGVRQRAHENRVRCAVGKPGALPTRISRCADPSISIDGKAGPVPAFVRSRRECRKAHAEIHRLESHSSNITALRWVEVG